MPRHQALLLILLFVVILLPVSMVIMLAKRMLLLVLSFTILRIVLIFIGDSVAPYPRRPDLFMKDINKSRRQPQPPRTAYRIDAERADCIARSSARWRINGCKGALCFYIDYDTKSTYGE